MNNIHTSSLTHEIESYGSRKDLLQFIKNRYDELVPNGVWINRDVVGPNEKDKEVYMLLNTKDGSNENPFFEFEVSHELSVYLQSLSTYSRFLRFAKDFRCKEGYQLLFKREKIDDTDYIKLSLK